MKPKLTATASTITPVPQDDARAFVADSDLHASLERLASVQPTRPLPIPRWRRADFLTCVLARVAEAASDRGETHGLAPREVMQLMVRRELREWFTLRPRTAALHRRLNTRRWRFARDGSF